MAVYFEPLAGVDFFWCMVHSVCSLNTPNSSISYKKNIKIQVLKFKKKLVRDVLNQIFFCRFICQCNSLTADISLTSNL